MDVGQVVTFNGLISAIFALLAGIALSVELGTAPTIGKKAKDNRTSDAPGGQAERKGTDSEGDTPSGNEPDESFERTVVNFTNQQPDAVAGQTADVGTAEQHTPDIDAIKNLQRTYVDGLLGPRIKYDVALAILNEYESTGVSEEEAGLMVATQAYLSATRTGSLRSRPFLLLGTGLKQTTEVDSVKAERSTTGETEKTLMRKPTAGDKNRPAITDSLLKPKDGEKQEKKRTSDDLSGGARRRPSTTRNTKSKNTRPE